MKYNCDCSGFDLLHYGHHCQETNQLTILRQFVRDLEQDFSNLPITVAPERRRELLQQGEKVRENIQTRFKPILGQPRPFFKHQVELFRKYQAVSQAPNHMIQSGDQRYGA